MSEQSIHTGYTDHNGQWVEREMKPLQAFDPDTTQGFDALEYAPPSSHIAVQELFTDAETGDPVYKDKPLSMVADAKETS